MFTVSALATTLFLGGWQAPRPISAINDGMFNAGWWGLLWFTAKLWIFMFFFVWLRGSLPRVRYDQFMRFGWKFLIPITLAWVVAVAFIRGAQLGFLGDSKLDLRRSRLLGRDRRASSASWPSSRSPRRGSGTTARRAPRPRPRPRRGDRPVRRTATRCRRCPASASRAAAPHRRRAGPSTAPSSRGAATARRRRMADGTSSTSGTTGEDDRSERLPVRPLRARRRLRGHLLDDVPQGRTEEYPEKRARRRRASTVATSSTATRTGSRSASAASCARGPARPTRSSSRAPRQHRGASGSRPGERYGRVYQINYLRCIFCGLCIEACPTRALTMTNEYELADNNRARADLHQGADCSPRCSAACSQPPHPMVDGLDERDYYRGKVTAPTPRSAPTSRPATRRRRRDGRRPGNASRGPVSTPRDRPIRWRRPGKGPP